MTTLCSQNVVISLSMTYLKQEERSFEYQKVSRSLPLKEKMTKEKKEEQKFINFRQEVLQSIRDTFLNRKNNNPRYSIRAYAKALDIDPTFLSRILSGKRPLTLLTAMRLANKLNLPIDKILKNFDEKRNISEAIFSPISRWYFFALLEIHRLTSFKNNRQWVAKKIGLDESELNTALEILTEQGHMNIDDSQWSVQLDESRWDGINDPSERKKDFQKQIINKAHNAIDNIPQTHRDAYSMSIAASSEVLPVIRQKIRNLSEEIAEICENSSNKDHVYQLHCSFFPLTQEDPGEII